MLETTANDLGYTVFEPTIQVLRMADQSRVVPLGKLTGIPTKIGETTYPLNYVILKIETGRPFPLLLGRPWLYLAEVRVDWGKKEFTFGNPPFPLPWKHEEHMGETSDTDGYTSDWSDQREEDSSMTYLVRNFKDQTEADYGFPEAVEEQGMVEDITDIPETSTAETVAPIIEDRSLGEQSFPLTQEWIHQQINEGGLPIQEGENIHTPPQWSELPDSVIDGADRVKAVVSPEDYEAVEVQPGKKFHLGKNLSAAERVEYIKLLSEFSDVFAWETSDLTGIPTSLGEHEIDLMEGAKPVRQRQYRLNPKYSAMVKEELEKLLEAGFIYPVNNTEWVSPIVVVPKKVGKDGKVKIRVCQDFRKLNAAT